MTDLTWVLSSCVLILAVIGIRAAFGKRMRPGLRYALWGLALLRLLIPTQLFSAPWGVTVELPERMTEQDIYVLPLEVADVSVPDQVIDGVAVPRENVEIRDPYAGDSFGYSKPLANGTTFIHYAGRVSMADILYTVWLVGAGVMTVVFLISNFQFYAQLRRRRRPLETDCPLRVYAVENLSSSCLFGNAIYVAAETAADETKLRHVLAHELSHHRHGDHVWALLRCAALALHWYNPLVWRAASLSRQDSELCADAGAVRRLGEAERENYGATLIELSARRAEKASLLCAATTMTNGKKSLKERVTMIARRPRMTAAVVIAVVLLSVAAAGAAFAGAAESKTNAEAPASGWLIDDDAVLAYVIEHYEVDGKKIQSGTYQMSGMDYRDDTMFKIYTVYTADGDEYTLRASGPARVRRFFGNPAPVSSMMVTDISYRLTGRRDGKQGSSEIDYAEEDAEFRFAEGTVFTYNGAEYDLTEWIPYVNAITNVRRAGRYLVIDGHEGPRNNVYYIFDTVTETFVKIFTGTHLIWRDDDLSTAVYAFYNGVLGGILDETTHGVVQREPERGHADEEYISGLSFTEDGEGLAVEIGGDGGWTEIYTLDGELTGIVTDVYFDGVMGLAGWYTEFRHGSFYKREYYSGGVRIAGSWGWDTEVFGDGDYSVDLDGDGVTELVCNVTYNADGASRVEVYRRSGNELMEGQLPSNAPALSDRDTLAGANATVERYDPETGVFTLEYPTRGGGRGVARFTMDDLEFRSYAIVSPDGMPTRFVNGGDTMLVYSNLLRELYESLSENGEAELPDGAGTLRLVGVNQNPEDNSFALCDVNGDGMDELILRFVTAPIIADMRDYIYCYDKHDMLGNGALWCAGSVFCESAYYEGGWLAEDFTHGSDPVFWPYFLHRYNAETGRYDLIAYAESGEDAMIVGTGYSDGGGFDHRERMDAAAYDAWVESWRGGAREIVPEWQDFTIRNIDALTR